MWGCSGLEAPWCTDVKVFMFVGRPTAFSAQLESLDDHSAVHILLSQYFCTYYHFKEHSTIPSLCEDYVINIAISLGCIRKNSVSVLL